MKMIFAAAISGLILGFSSVLMAADPLAQNAPPNMLESKVEDVKGAVKTSKVYFVEPRDGATVAPKFRVKMAVEGLKVRPAGEAPDDIMTGHHHILINLPVIPAGQPIPTDENHLHFGKGQTEVEVNLKPGKYTLTLQFADGAHRSYGRAMSQTITVTVK